jgi:phenylpyruvate tautomerase PptA (4-oxalocrotonate tautomerase family)
VYIQITVFNTRTAEQKKALFRRIAELLGESPGIRPEGVFVNVLDAAKENWSVGHSRTLLEPEGLCRGIANKGRPREFISGRRRSLDTRPWGNVLILATMGKKRTSSAPDPCPASGDRRTGHSKAGRAFLAQLMHRVLPGGISLLAGAIVLWKRRAGREQGSVGL